MFCLFFHNRRLLQECRADMKATEDLTEGKGLAKRHILLSCIQKSVVKREK